MYMLHTPHLVFGVAKNSGMLPVLHSSNILY